MRNRATVILYVLLVLVAFAKVVYWVRTPNAPASAAIPAPRTYTADEAKATWRSMRPPQSTVDIRGIGADDALRILVDVNCDGVIDDADAAARAHGAAKIVRLDDAICNGRGGVYDRSPVLDDDLQLLTLQLPKGAAASDELRLDNADGLLDNLVFYSSDLLVDDVSIRWPVTVGALPFRDITHDRVFVWLKAKDKFASGRAEGSITLALDRAGKTIARDTLPLVLVGKLGDKNYFAGALDYLMARDRITGKRAKLFLDETPCPSSAIGAGVETFRLVLMRHDLAEMNVLETYYANQHYLRARINNIFDAMARNPHEDLIINGSFFQLENRLVNHGRRVLGAVVNNYKLSPASTPHFWQVAYQESGVSGTPDWRYKSFCLYQPAPGPGAMTLAEEPFSPKEVFVPKVEHDGKEGIPYMALGGLHQVHNFENNPGCNKACMGIVDAPGQPGAAPDPRRRLIWIAATDTDHQKTTSCYGGEALRQQLRDSGLIIEEGNPKHGVGPGRCDLVYFDSANSVALAYKVDEAFETPCVSGRHLPNAASTLVNNYLMLKIADADSLRPAAD